MMTKEVLVIAFCCFSDKDRDVDACGDKLVTGARVRAE